MRSDTPESAAEAALEQARAEAAANRNAAMWRPPLLYRFAELRRLEPRQRSRVLREACAQADRELPVLLACLAWLALIAVGVLLLPSAFLGLGGSVVLVFAAALPFVLLRRARVLHHVRARLAQDTPNG